MIRIYAVRDRLIDYYMQPFCGPDDNQVKAALARTVNNGETTSDIAQAPHHFELWHLGQVSEDGNLHAERYLVCDCSSLIRTGVREGAATTGHKGLGADEKPGTGTAEHRGDGPPRRTHNGSVPLQAPPAESPTGEIRGGPQGGYPPRNGQ